MVVRWVIVVVLSMGAIAAAPAPVACACSCKALTTTEAVDAASAVFSGDVLSMTEPASLGSGDPVYYRIRVNRVYKGDLPALVTVSSAASEASCGIRLAGKVTVFATGPTDGLRSSFCAAPVTLDIKALGAGARPTAGPPATPTEGTPSATYAPEPAPSPASAGAVDRLAPSLVTLAVVLAIAAGTIALVSRPRP